MLGICWDIVREVIQLFAKKTNKNQDSSSLSKIGDQNFLLCYFVNFPDGSHAKHGV